MGAKLVKEGLQGSFAFTNSAVNTPGHCPPTAVQDTVRPACSCHHQKLVRHFQKDVTLSGLWDHEASSYDACFTDQEACLPFLKQEHVVFEGYKWQATHCLLAWLFRGENRRSWRLCHTPNGWPPSAACRHLFFNLYLGFSHLELIGVTCLQTISRVTFSHTKTSVHLISP